MKTTQKQRMLALWGMVALILAAMIIYMPPFIRSFVGDDYIQFDYIKPFVLHPTTILGVFNPTAVSWYYRPTQNIWFWLNRLILGWEPFGYYIILLWFHALAVALIFRVARQFRMGVGAALLTAVLFAIHGHWVDVVTWISSVAIVLGAILSLAAVSGMVGYVQRPSPSRLLLVFIMTLLALLTHEETVLLPPFLLLLLVIERLGYWDIGGLPRRSRAALKTLLSRQELLVFGLLALLTAVLIILQFTRPNPTVQLSERTLAEWLAYLRWPKMAEFVLVTTYRLSFVNGVLGLSGFAANLFVAGVGFVLVVWLWQGNWVVRFWLLWALAHLFFIYWALWSQLPNLYAGRHIYQAGMGFALAIGGTVQMGLEIFNAKGQRGKEAKGRKKKREGNGSWARENWGTLLVLVLLTAVTIHNILEVRVSQRVWLANVTEEETAKTQLYALIPTLPADTHIFSFRFPISPDFTRSVMQVWYDLPLERPGGALKHLAAHGRADPSFLVLDYAHGQVYNLMPELAEVDETIFLWVDQVAEMNVAAGQNGGETDRRLAVSLTPIPGEWTGTSYRITVPERVALHTAVLAQPDITYRLRLGDEIVFEQAALPTNSPATWVDVVLPLVDRTGEKVEMWLEATAVTETDQIAYWANPRLVR